MIHILAQTEMSEDWRNYRHRASTLMYSTLMYSLTFRVRVTTPRSMDERELPRCR